MIGTQLHVAAAPVAFGADPVDDAGLLEDPQVVGQQVAAQPDVGAELAGRGVPEQQVVHHGHPHRLGQRGQDPRPLVVHR